MKLELLSPAKNYEQGREAISHGADAVYIGAPAFGARAAVGNNIEDIERLVHYAHLYHARVFATVNTLLFDHEVEEAVRLLHQLYNAGVDAAIIQDLGLLECDLPPIELHASTQTHNLDPRRIQFLHRVGFRRVILARETSLQQMRQLSGLLQEISTDSDTQPPPLELEAFVQGALCVCYSGQCYLSQYLTGRSGNRGCCTQPCRSAYSLYNAEGRMLIKDRHLLSLRDLNTSALLGQMVEAGITSFKIEGRLKDMAYVKNLTAHYRLLLDRLMEGREDLQPPSSGHCRYFFTPDPEKTFNRGFCDYFLQRRQPMAQPYTPKSMGKRIGTVAAIRQGAITLRGGDTLTPGDGLCYFDSHEQLVGFLVNQVQGNTFRPNRMPSDLKVGTQLWRNHDQAFEQLLQGRTTERKINVSLVLSDTADGLHLDIVDVDGYRGTAEVACTKEVALNPDRALSQLETQLRRLGDTIFEATEVRLHLEQPYHLPAALLNQLRRLAVAQLEEVRLQAHLSRRGDSPSLPQRQSNTTPYFETHLDYRGNVLNQQSEQFYRRHGATVEEYGVEKTEKYDDKDLMTTRYCLRYELGICPRHPEQPLHPLLPQNTTKPPAASPLYLHNGNHRFRLFFDCGRCQMRIQASS